MENNIHSTAILDGDIKLGKNIQIGPFTVLKGDISIGDNTIIKNHVNIEGNVEIGKNNQIYPFSSIGTAPQDIKFQKNTLSKVIIGDNNIIREYVTINGGGNEGNLWKNIKNTTIVGNNCYLYISCHIAHDVILENNVTVTNLAGISGHVLIEDNVIIGGMSGIHQNVKIGKNCMIGAICPIGASVPPFCLTAATDVNKIFSLNIVGLRRHGFSNEDIKLIAKIYNFHFKDKLKKNILSNLDLTFNNEELNSKLYLDVQDFFSNLNSRGVLNVSDRIIEYGF